MSHETENPGQETAKTEYPIVPSAQFGVEIYDEQAAEHLFVTAGGLAPLVDAVREIVGNTILQTDADRIALAKMVRKTANEAEKYGKNLAALYKARPKIIDGNRKHVADSLDNLHAAIMQPLTERKARADRLAAIAAIPAARNMATIAEIDDELQRLYDINPAEFVELADEFTATRAKVQSELLAIKAKREQEEKDRAELQRLRDEEAKRAHETAMEQARLEGEKRARERMEREQADQADKQAREAVAPTVAPTETEPAPQANAYDMAYADIKAVVLANGFGDLAANITHAIIHGKIRNVTITIRSV